MQSHHQILVSSHGLAADEKVALITVIKLLTRDGKVFKLVSDNVTQAHLLVLNIDSESGRDCFKSSRDGQVKLLITNRTQTGKNIIPVKKPVEISALKDVLGKLFEKMQKQLELTMGNIPRTGGVTNDATHNLTNTLFHLLLKTKENSEHVSIRSVDYPEVVVDGENKSVSTTASDEQLSHIINTSLTDISVSQPAKAANKKENNAAKIFSLDDILWMAAIHCSKGQLLPGHKTNELVRLKAWPNFTRNDFRPSHLKLAAVLAKSPVALDKLEQLTEVPQAEIIDFYNAAYAVDLIDKNIANTQTASPKRNITREKKGLLSKIASRLGFGQQNLNIAGA